MKDYNLGYHNDQRHYNNGALLMARAIEKKSLNIDELADSNAERIKFKRFLESENVTSENIESAITSKTNMLCADVEHVLAIQDTSELSFPSQNSKHSDFGPTGNKYGSGYFIHPNVIVNLKNKEILGYGSIDTWKREKNLGLYLIDDFSKKNAEEQQEILLGLTSDATILEPKINNGSHYMVYFVRHNKIIKTKDGRAKSIEYKGKINNIDEKVEDISYFNISLMKKLRNTAGIRKTKNGSNIEDKESYKWTKSAIKTVKNLNRAAKITHVADRESDDYAFMSEIANLKNNYFVIRTYHDRETDKNRRIAQLITESPVKAKYKLELQRTPKRSARTATLELKFGDVNIKKPVNLKSEKEHNPELNIFYVDVTEIENRDDKISWRLYTNHTVTNESEAYEILDIYLSRWLVEMIFTILKTKGFNLENNQVKYYEKTIKLCLIGFNAALQVFFLSNATEYDSKIKIERVFSKEELNLLYILCAKYEGKTEKQKNKFKKNSLQWVAWVIKRIGGWKGYKSDSQGIMTINRGLGKFYLIYEGWLLTNSDAENCEV